MTENSETGVPELHRIHPEHLFDEAALHAYLKKHGLVGRKMSMRQFEGGQSNPTFLVEAGTARYVLRKQPPGEILPSAHRVDREYRIMTALADVPGIPVPATHLFCEDAAVVGTPFYIMDFVAGRVFSNPALPGLEPSSRTRIHHGMIDTLATLHAVDIESIGLADFGKHQDYIARQINLWWRQYNASTNEASTNMTALNKWLLEHVPLGSDPAIAHGDFRVGNLLLAEDFSHVAAVLDWELATLGHPLADLAHACMPYYLPAGKVGITGLEGLNLEESGIPSEADQLKRYCTKRGIGPIEDWPVFIAFALYRMAAILQGVHARALAGNASSKDAREVGEQAALMAERGWRVAQSFD